MKRLQEQCGNLLLAALILAFSWAPSSLEAWLKRAGYIDNSSEFQLGSIIISLVIVIFLCKKLPLRNRYQETPAAIRTYFLIPLFVLAIHTSQYVAIALTRFFLLGHDLSTAIIRNETSIADNLRSPQSFSFYVVSILVVPIIEELLCRGIFLDRLLKNQKAIFAILFSCAIFTLLHTNPFLELFGVRVNYSAVAPLFISGLILTFVRLRFSLAHAIIVHAMFNIWNFLLGMLIWTK